VANLAEYTGEMVTCCGLIIEDRLHQQVTGELMKFMTIADWTGIVGTELFADTYRSYGLATVRYPVLKITARVEPFENGNGFTLRVMRAANGEEGLRVAGGHKAEPLRLVITDVVMPKLGGKEMAEWMATIYPHIKILFTSGYTDDAIAHHGVLETGVAFLPKPYAPAALTRKVREMLDASS
jgi:CheY-like chemotaxis protein